MDTKTLAEAAGVQAPTLNTWISRGAIPDIATGTRGRAREFSVEEAVLIAVITELVRFGLGAPTAAGYAAHYVQQPYKRLLLRHNLPADISREFYRVDDDYQWQPMEPAAAEQLRKQIIDGPPSAFGFDDETQLAGIFARYGSDRMPAAYAVINLDGIRKTMARVEQEWQTRRKAPG